MILVVPILVLEGLFNVEQTKIQSGAVITRSNNMTLHTSLQLLKPNITQSLGTQKTLHISAVWVSYVVYFVRVFWGKITVL